MRCVCLICHRNSAMIAWLRLFQKSHIVVTGGWEEIFLNQVVVLDFKCCSDLSFSLFLLRISIVVVVVEKIHVVCSGVGCEEDEVVKKMKENKNVAGLRHLSRASPSSFPFFFFLNQQFKM